MQDENGNTVPPRIALVKSTMTRATQTGDIVHSQFPGVEIKPCDLLREGGPCMPDPPVGTLIFYIFSSYSYAILYITSQMSYLVIFEY
jgi:hypothetical protein